MKTKYLFLGLCAAMVLPMSAQETYEIANLATKELNGTARYVGMGGAMDALGGDISTISSNPAGIGVYHSNDAAVSFGFVSQQDAKNFASGKTTNMSFDQVGFVYSMNTGGRSMTRMNFGFSYHKSRNFDFILNAANSLSNASQQKLTYEKMKNGVIPNASSVSGEYTPNGNSNTYSQTDYLYYSAFGTRGYYEAESYEMLRANKGYIGDYDFNMSFNFNDRVFLGLTLGIYDVHYNNYSEYSEKVRTNVDNLNTIALADQRKITGSGVDLKAGVIFRPIEDSPFRIGLTVSSPTYYNLRSENSTDIYCNSNREKSAGESFNYDFYTPWSFGVSLGHTIGNYLALGASYDYEDYSACDARIDNGGGDGYYDDTYSDEAMNKHIGYTLKGVSTFKVGLELKPDPSLAIRLGYNYVSPMYQNDGQRDAAINSPSNYYSSTTDFTNWKGTNRITCGLGFRIDRCYMDLAYQYSTQKGDFYPFSSYVDNTTTSDNNIPTMTKIENKRHQVLFTLGYKF